MTMTVKNSGTMDLVYLNNSLKIKDKKFLDNIKFKKNYLILEEPNIKILIRNVDMRDYIKWQ